MKFINKIVFVMMFCSLQIALGSEDYEAYRRSVIQNIVERTGDSYDDYSGEPVPGSAQKNKIAVEAALQSLFDEQAKFLQNLFARSTNPEFLPYIQEYENLKGSLLRSDIKIFFSESLQEILNRDKETLN